MQRTNIKIPTAILCSDFHLRESTPVCYTGDYQKEQWNSVDFISNLQKKHHCPIFFAGDLFDHWKPSPWLLTKASEHLPNDILAVYGQHDLPQHNIDLANKCGMWNLMTNGKLSILQQGYWGWEPAGGKGLIWKNREILIWHHLTYQQKPFPGASGGMASGVLRKYPQYDLIVTGDNHQSFVEEYKGRYLVNPGSLMRMDADQINFKPCVYLWYAEDNSIQQVFIPIVPNVITRAHIEQAKQRDLRISAFVSKLDGDWKTSMSFEENLDEFFKTNNTKEPIKQIIYQSLE